MSMNLLDLRKNYFFIIHSILGILLISTEHTFSLYSDENDSKGELLKPFQSYMNGDIEKISVQTKKHGVIVLRKRDLDILLSDRSNDENFNSDNGTIPEMKLLSKRNIETVDKKSNKAIRDMLSTLNNAIPNKKSNMNNMKSRMQTGSSKSKLNMTEGLGQQVNQNKTQQNGGLKIPLSKNITVNLTCSGQFKVNGSVNIDYNDHSSIFSDISTSTGSDIQQVTSTLLSTTTNDINQQTLSTDLSTNTNDEVQQITSTVFPASTSDDVQQTSSTLFPLNTNDDSKQPITTLCTTLSTNDDANQMTSIQSTSSCDNVSLTTISDVSQEITLSTISNINTGNDDNNALQTDTSCQTSITNNPVAPILTTIDCFPVPTNQTTTTIIDLKRINISVVNHAFRDSYHRGKSILSNPKSSYNKKNYNNPLNKKKFTSRRNNSKFDHNEEYIHSKKISESKQPNSPVIII